MRRGDYLIRSFLLTICSILPVIHFLHYQWNNIVPWYLYVDSRIREGNNDFLLIYHLWRPATSVIATWRKSCYYGVLLDFSILIIQIHISNLRCILLIVLFMLSLYVRCSLYRIRKDVFVMDNNNKNSGDDPSIYQFDRFFPTRRDIVHCINSLVPNSIEIISPTTDARLVFPS